MKSQRAYIKHNKSKPKNTVSGLYLLRGKRLERQGRNKTFLRVIQ